MKTESMKAIEAEIIELEKEINTRLSRLATMMPLTSIRISITSVSGPRSEPPQILSKVGLEYRMD